MNKQKIINEVAKTVKRNLKNEGSGHDWWHVYRVWKMAKHIGKKESVNMFIVELAALLHDIADWKFHSGDDTIGPKKAKQFLIKYKVSKDIIDHVCNIIATMSFKGAGVKTEMKTIEGKVVQDADRLDAIGAVGIGRAFAYGGYENRPMYDPNKKFAIHQSKEEYFKSKISTIHHFYEKLLFLKEHMNTKTAREIAQGRHKFIELFLERFFQEWEGKI